jgi:hypothetical protein
VSLKDEIEKLIQAERQKLESRDRQRTEYHERQRQRFQPLKTLLTEVAASVEAEFIEPRISDDSAVIEIGRKKEGPLFTDIRWRIEPDFEVGSVFKPKDGFRVEETAYYRYPESDVSERTHRFEAERHVAEYLIAKIAEKVAFYRHLDNKSAAEAKACRSSQ